MHPDSLDTLHLDSVRQQVTRQLKLQCISSNTDAAMMPMPGQLPGRPYWHPKCGWASAFCYKTTFLTIAGACGLHMYPCAPKALNLLCSVV